MTLPEVPRLSPSIAAKLLNESPLSAWANHRLLGNMKPESTDSQIEGRLWHAVVLEDSSDVVVVEADNFKGKEAREQRDMLKAAGKLPVPRPKFDELKPAAERIRAALLQYDIHLNGTVEQRFEWTEYTDAGEPVECSAYLDHYDESGILDLKSSKGPVALFQAVNLIARSHSLLQDPAYRNALAAMNDDDPERIEVVFAFFQTREPHSITPVTLAGDFRELARMRWRRAIHLWHACLSKGTDRKYWPGPVEAITPISAPGWMLAQEIELEVQNGEE